MDSRFLKAVFALLLLFGSPLLAQSSHPSIPSLQDAINSGRLTVNFEGTGGSSGDSVKARTAKGPKAPPGPVEAEVPPGSQFPHFLLYGVPCITNFLGLHLCFLP
jgi:hypothetical protein